ncbi:BQ5605_C006g04116 [Microbotryum silenes-dioicae]|uniref:BQ5605_C006g04116 protein n=1 Tax=Microbotryum silenes-dioicae TaxID=796604 RepID=A0A2X0M603_9BASI|nr:BQ5605_C006g04116 [Microbotryum silenes-dioicae]
MLTSGGKLRCCIYLQTCGHRTDPNYAQDKSASSSRHPKGSSWKLCNE